MLLSSSEISIQGQGALTLVCQSVLSLTVAKDEKESWVYHKKLLKSWLKTAKAVVHPLPVWIFSCIKGHQVRVPSWFLTMSLNEASIQFKFPSVRRAWVGKTEISFALDASSGEYWSKKAKKLEEYTNSRQVLFIKRWAYTDWIFLMWYHLRESFSDKLLGSLF